MDMQNLLNKLNGLLAEETSNPEPEQLSLGLHQMVDMSGEPCIRCKKGHYTETSISDDWDGVNHCSKCNHRITRHLTTDELNKLKKSVSESDEAGPIKQCVSCGDKAHVDYITGMCVDCQTKAEEKQGLSESPMGRRAPDEPHTCETCGRPMPNWEPGDGAECDECAEGMSPEDSDPDELDEASATKHALYGQMKKTSNPSNYKPEISDEPIGTDDYDTDHFEVDDNVSCWGCGQDWKENWSAEDLGTGEGYAQHGLEPEDTICPDCAEELTGGELNEAEMPAVPRPQLEKLHNLGFENSPEGKKARENWKTATGQAHPADQQAKGRKTQKSSTNADLNTVPVGWIYMMSDGELLIVKVPKDNLTKFIDKINQVQEDTGYGIEPWVPVDLKALSIKLHKQIQQKYQKIKPITDANIPTDPDDLDEFLQNPKNCIWIADDEVMWDYNKDKTAIVGAEDDDFDVDDEDDLDEAAMCEDCGASPCVCEDPLAEAKAKNYYAVATAAIKKKYDLGPGKVDLTDAQTTEAHKLAKKLKKDDQKLKESEQDGAAELGQLKRMMECWGPMAAPQASGMNVTTNVDSKTGNKTVTVTADGEGAEDLMQILAMAGIAITPAPVAATPVGEQVANEPAPQTLDAQTQLVDMAGGPNAPHAQYNPDRARDNSMAIVDEAVDRLASKLRAKFQNQ